MSFDMLKSGGIRKDLGSFGEDVAERFLKKKGFEILEKNWRNRWGEIDLIVRNREVLVFVEVKTKSSDDFGTPEEMVDRRKIERIRNTSLYYDIDYDGLRRIDVVAITLNGFHKVEEIRHYENVG